MEALKVRIEQTGAGRWIWAVTTADGRTLINSGDASTEASAKGQVTKVLRALR